MLKKSAIAAVYRRQRYTSNLGSVNRETMHVVTQFDLLKLDMSAILSVDKRKFSVWP